MAGIQKKQLETQKRDVDRLEDKSRHIYTEIKPNKYRQRENDAQLKCMVPTHTQTTNQSLVVKEHDGNKILICSANEENIFRKY